MPVCEIAAKLNDSTGIWMLKTFSNGLVNFSSICSRLKNQIFNYLIFKYLSGKNHETYLSTF